MRRRLSFAVVERLFVAGAVIATAVGMMVPTGLVAGAASSGGAASTDGLQLLGTTNVRVAAPRAAAHSGSPTVGRPEFAKHSTSDMKPLASALTITPGNPTPLPVVGKGAALAIDGLAHVDQRSASNGNQFSHEPSDGAICAGPTNEVEMVNSALQFFDTNGAVQTPPISLNEFWGLPPEIDRTTLTYPGPGLGDIRCIFDTQSQRFFLLAWGLDVNPTTGALTGTQAYYVAAQATADPLGAYNLFKFGLEPPTQPGCSPICEADFPATSSDANTFVVTYDRFLANGTFSGGRILVFSKSDLLAPRVGPVRKFNPGSVGGGPVGAIMGAQVPAGGTEATANGGTHYLVAALDPLNLGDNRAALFALTNTSAIDTHPANVHLNVAVVPGVLPYALPPQITQKPGPRPLGTSLKTLLGVPNEPINKLDGGGDSATPAKFAGGNVWTVIDTQVGSGSSARSGLLGLAITPHWTEAGLRGTVAVQGYAAVATNSLDYGDIAVTPDGTSGVVVASLAGPTVYPSAVYLTFSAATGAPTAVHEYLAGARPEDGFTCYTAFVGPGPGGSGRGCRWGDYSMANISPTGAFWFETEYITARARTVFADWGTAMGRL